MDAVGASFIDSFVVRDELVGPFHMAFDYYNYSVESERHNRLKQQYFNENAQNKACFLPWLSRTLCPFIPQSTFLQHGFLLSHTDFGPHNLLVDNKGNVKAVIDWNSAQTLLWESFYRFPRLLEVQWLRRHKYSNQVWEQLMNEQEYYLCSRRWKRCKIFTKIVIFYPIWGSKGCRRDWVLLLCFLVSRRMDQGLVWDNIWRWNR